MVPDPHAVDRHRRRADGHLTAAAAVRAALAEVESAEWALQDHGGAHVVASIVTDHGAMLSVALLVADLLATLARRHETLTAIAEDAEQRAADELAEMFAAAGDPPPADPAHDATGEG